MFKSSAQSSLHLKSTKKYISNDGNISTRVKSAEDTLFHITPVCIKIGLTRISDITNLDRLGIPNYSAILPGTEDSIWVYSGKGTTKIQAQTSALMESIERYCSLSKTFPKSYLQGTQLQLSKTYNNVLHPLEVVEPVESSYNERKSITDFVQGFDLLNNEEVLVPAQLVFSKYSAKPPSTYVFSYSHTNGLASGNVLEEAICHAFCELIERDAASIADLCASSIPYSILKEIIDSVKKVAIGKNQVTPTHEDSFVDDSSIFPDVNISEIAGESEALGFLVKKFDDAELSLLVKDITQSDIRIPTFVASSVDWITADYGYFAKGYGAHPDANIALIRAITELSQTRAANIQGARDDFRKINYKQADEIYKRKWQFIPALPLPISEAGNNTRNLSEIKSHVNKDILDDIKLILKLLKNAGLNKAIVVDLTNPNVGIPVVRAIVPGLETFEVAKLFTNTELFMGRRAKRHFRNILTSK